MVIKYLLLFSLLFASPLHASIAEEDFDEARHRITHLALRNFKNAMQAKGLSATGIGEGIDHSNG